MIKADELLQVDELEWLGTNDPSQDFLSQEHNQNLVFNIESRIHSINHSMLRTIQNARQPLESATREIAGWIRDAQIVRVIGAGRARLAAAMPANRLHHAGARVFVIYDTIPLPNSIHGGGIIAASASGKTPAVLQIMRDAKRYNPKITIIGIASEAAADFKALSDIFIPIDERLNPIENPLQALADTGEQIISQLLDAIIVAAARATGKTDEDFRKGHEDLGATGPWFDNNATMAEKDKSAQERPDEDSPISVFTKCLYLLRHQKLSTVLAYAILEELGIQSISHQDLIDSMICQKKLQPDLEGSLLIMQSEDLELSKDSSVLHLVLFAAYKSINNGRIDFTREMIYHSLQHSDYDSAYGCIFSTGNLENWFNQGRSLEVIELLNEYSESIDFYETRRQAKIFLAKAEAYSSISDHHSSLACLKNAFRCIAPDDRSSDTSAAKRSIWRHAGISSGDLGRTKDAMTFYRKAIEEDLSCIDPKTALCMGYLGYLYGDQLKFDLAQRWCGLALDMCTQYRDPHIYCKNLTNSALVHLYSGNIQGSIDGFNRALEIARGTERDGGDIREYGRILCHKGLALFPFHRGSNNLINELSAAHVKCLDSGDKRRMYLALGLLGIARIQSDDPRGPNDLSQSISELAKINDYRNAAFFTLSYIHLKISRFKQIDDLSGKILFHKEDISRLSPVLADYIIINSQWQFFWWNCLKPILFEISCVGLSEY